MNRSSLPTKLRALTLVETLGALVLLSLILGTAALVGMHTSNQWVNATTREIAVDHADRLLTEWWADPESIPINQEGDIPETDTWRWRTTPLPTPDLDQAGVMRLRVDILELVPNESPIVRTSIVILVPVPQTNLESDIEAGVPS